MSEALDAHEHNFQLRKWEYMSFALFNGGASGNLFIAFNNSTLLAEVFIHRRSRQNTKERENAQKVK